MRTVLIPVLLSGATGLGASQLLTGVPPTLDDVLHAAGIVGFAAALAVLVFEFVAWRQEAARTKQSAAHERETHRRPVRVLQFARWPVSAEEAPVTAVPPKRWAQALRTVSLAIVTPLLEKNVVKTLSLDVPVIFSMSRVVVLAFAVGMLRQIWRAGIAGWPEAMLAIAVVLALPVLGALERVAPEQVVELTRLLVGRFGTGDVRKTGSVYSAESREPSAYEEHLKG